MFYIFWAAKVKLLRQTVFKFDQIPEWSPVLIKEILLVAGLVLDF